MRNSTFRPDYHWRSALLTLLAIALSIMPAAAQRGGRGGLPAAPMPSSDPQFRFMGPAVGNRISAAAGIPGDPTTYYAGAASGGVWKSTDSGKSFVPVFDGQPVMAIGSLAVARSNPNIVWAGTGEAWAIRDSDMMGDGVYKSTDAGATWTNMGLKETGRVGRILVNPTNPDIVFVCGAHDRSAVGARRVPHQRRREDVDALARRRPGHRLLGSVDGLERSQYVVRRRVEGGDAYLRHVQRRSR
jgi:hypothetical protein